MQPPNTLRVLSSTRPTLHGLSIGEGSGLYLTWVDWDARGGTLGSPSVIPNFVWTSQTLQFVEHIIICRYLVIVSRSPGRVLHQAKRAGRHNRSGMGSSADQYD